ncbi:MAG: ParA family protein [Myxococcota bacterium]
MSQKGGVGKTTLALNLGYALARRGSRVCVVDLDPQGAIGLSLTRKMAQRPGVVDWLRDRIPVAELLVETREPRLSLLPVGKVQGVETHDFQSALASGERVRRLVETLDGFDVVLLDTPSGFVGATLGALRGASHGLVPVQAEPIAARTLMRTFETLKALQKEGQAVTLLGLVMTMLQRDDGSSLAIAEDIWKTVPKHMVFETSVPRSPVFLEASAAGVPLGLLSQRPPPEASGFDVLASEVERRIGLHAEDERDAPIALVD